MNWLRMLREWWRANVPPLPKWQGWRGQIECEIKHFEHPPKPLPGDEEANLWP